MSKLIVTIARLGSGGAERVLSILSGPLANHFDEVIYVIWDGGTIYYTLDNRIRLLSLPDCSHCKGRMQQIPTFRRIVKQETPDLILSFLTPINMLVLTSTLCMKIPVIVAERNDPMFVSGGKPAMLVRDMLYKRAKGILAQTEYAKSCYHGSLNKKTTVIYNPVIMSNDLVGSALLSEKEKMIVSVGSLGPKKDQATLIRAFHQFYQKHKDYKLVIYGEGKLRGTLEQFIVSLGLKDIVLLPGSSKQVWEAMKKAEIFTLSSTHEGMSNAMIEAMCLGLPVVTTRVAGSTDLINSGENGFIVDVKDVNALAEKMILLVDNPGLRMTVGREAIKVYDKLHVDKISKQWVEYLSGELE